MTSGLDRDEFTAGYLIEADEHVRSAVSHLLAIEEALRSGASQHRHVRELFRALHTLKGLSAMVGIDPIVDVAHELETIVRDADRGTAQLTAESVDLLLQGVRAIEARVDAFSKQQPIAAAPRGLLDALIELHTGALPPPTAAPAVLSLQAEIARKLLPRELEHLAQSIAAGKRALRVDFAPSPTLSTQGTTITTVRERLAQLGEIVKVIPSTVPKTERAPAGIAFAMIMLSEATDAAIAEAAYADPEQLFPIVFEGAAPALESLIPPLEEEEAYTPGAHQRSYIRVEAARLDDALEKLSALVVTRFRLARAANTLREQGVDVRELLAILHDNHRQLRDLRRAITRARMVSVSELLERVPLIVRGMQRTTGKQVKLVVDAGHAELDKAVAERVFPALVHLVRNAIDHAIEPSAERERLGKPANGTVTVACFEHSDTQLEIRISDDGRGIDAAAVAQRAGRPVPTDARGMLELITLPGLSTLDVATNNSGRGMGMDIVRRIAVDMLGGDLSLHTTQGQGTTFTIRLPLSISILDSFSFVCAEQTFAVPVSIVDKIIDLEAEQILASPTPRRGHSAGADLRLLEHGGEAIPLFGLSALLELGAPPKKALGKAFIIRPQGQPFAFAVDRMLGQQEIVVRPIEDPLVKVPGVAGTTDLGDGQPTLVLDLVGLSSVATRARGMTGRMAEV